MKFLFGIFAHPDDEAFGIAATICEEVDRGTNVHMVTLTDGGGGSNPDNHPDLASVRREECRDACKILGVTESHCWGYIDGELDNKTMIIVADRIKQLVIDVVANDDNAVVEFVMLDANGLTGHIDHIVATRAACLAFYRLREQGLSMARIRMRVLPLKYAPTSNTNWIYMDSGRSADEIDEVVEAPQYEERVRAAIAAHRTQRHDAQQLLDMAGNDICKNYYCILR